MKTIKKLFLILTLSTTFANTFPSFRSKAKSPDNTYKQEFLMARFLIQQNKTAEAIKILEAMIREIEEQSNNQIPSIEKYPLYFTATFLLGETYFGEVGNIKHINQERAFECFLSVVTQSYYSMVKAKAHNRLGRICSWFPKLFTNKLIKKLKKKYEAFRTFTKEERLLWTLECFARSIETINLMQQNARYNQNPMIMKDMHETVISNMYEIAKINEAMGNFDTAIEVHTETIKKSNNVLHNTMRHNQIGDLYRNWGHKLEKENKKESEAKFKQAKKHFKVVINTHMPDADTNTKTIMQGYKAQALSALTDKKITKNTDERLSYVQALKNADIKNIEKLSIKFEKQFRMMNANVTDLNRDYKKILQENLDIGKKRFTCQVCGIIKSSMKICSRCKDAFYCSRECQAKDWKKHKKSCCKK